MASLSEQLIGAVTQQTAGIDEKGLAQSYNQGAQLALEAERLGQARKQLEQQKQEAMMSKFEKVGQWFDTASKMADGAAKKAFVSKFIPTGVSALGLDDKFDPIVMEMLQGDPLLASKLAQDMRSGAVDFNILANAEGLADYASAQNLNLEKLKLAAEGNLDLLQKASKERADDVQSERNAEITQMGQSTRQQVDISSTPKVQASKKIADSFADYEANGGKATFESGIDSLENVLKTLETGKVETGGISTFIPGFKSDAVQTMVNPKMVSLRTDAQAALNQTLRQTLGAQFTQQEGERVLAQIWDDKQPPKENARRIRNKIKSLKKDMYNREKQFSKEGFQFEGSKYAVSQPDKAAPVDANWKSKVNQQVKDSYKKFSAPKKAEIIKRLSEQFNVSPEEIKKVMGE